VFRQLQLPSDTVADAEIASTRRQL